MENTATFKIKTDLRQSPEYGKYISQIGWSVVGNNPKIFIRKLGPFGAIAKIQRFASLDWQKVKAVLKSNRVWMTKLEPLYEIKNFAQDSWPMLATKTLRVDLRPALEKIESQFKKDSRYELRRLRKDKHKIIINDFESFYRIWKSSGKLKGLWIPPRKDYDTIISAFGKNCFCITIDDLSGSFVLIYKSVAYYYYSGSLLEGKRQNLPYLVIWECMREAKKRGCKIWDFEGIYDPRWPNKGWLGFSHFKKSFGGTEISFPGSFTKWF